MSFKSDETARIIGSILVIVAYFTVLHIDSKIGAGIHFVADAISLPFFIRTRAFDVVIMMMFLLTISTSKLIA
tara:strand:- start:2569 stop:2787 length:219 start_codon:yes stop_codon:yes gene_type:complete